jgi:hypothetical protein
MRDFATDPTGLSDVLSSVRRSLAGRATADTGSTVERRVAASVGFLGLAARLVSPALGVLATSGVLPELDWADLWWRRGVGAQLSIAAGMVTGAPVAGPEAMIGPSGVAAVLRMAVAPILDLGGIVGDRYGVSPLIIRGNVASAIFGALTVIVLSAAANADPRIAARAGQLARDLLAQPQLSGAGSINATADRPATFSRRSCCLLYRAPGMQLCGDCVLHRR